MKISEIRDLREDELEIKLDETQTQLFAMRSQAMTEKIEDTCAIGNLKRDIARMKTIIREKELKGQ